MLYNNYLKVALVSPKVYLGKPLQNANEIIKILNKENLASILVFPELSLIGANCGDLVFNQGFLNEVEQALDYLVNNSNEKIIIVGFPLDLDGRLYNVSCAIQNKKILGIVPKNVLVNNDVYCESRYFSTLSLTEYGLKKIFNQEIKVGNILFKDSINNFSFMIKVGNDILLNNDNCDIIFNPCSLSYFQTQQEMLKDSINFLSYRDQCAYLMVSSNTSASASDVIFNNMQIASVNGDNILNKDATSFDNFINYVDIDLETIAFKKRKNLSNINQSSLIVDFTFELANEFQFEKLPAKLPFVPKTNEEFQKIIEVTSAALKHRMDHIGIKKVVIGVSGGLDSTLALLFSYYTFKKYHLNVKNIIGITMPGMGSGTKFKSIANKLMEKMEITKKEMSIKKQALNELKAVGHNLENKDITYENVQARLRTLNLMTVANFENAIVIGTGDMSEIALGWSTFGGDQLSMYNLNSGLAKTTIKALVEYFSNFYPQLKIELKKVYQAVISPELTGSDQATEDTIGKYEINDFIMYHLFNNGASQNRIIFLLKKVFNLSLDNAIKYYESFIKRFKTNQFKRLTGAEGIKIFNVSLSPREALKIPGDLK